jgi:hypothetical protein
MKLRRGGHDEAHARLRSNDVGPRARPRRPGAIILVLSLSMALTGIACMHDFDTFEGADAFDGSNQGSETGPVRDATTNETSSLVDSGSTCTSAPQACLTDRNSCQNACDTTRTTCENNCAGGGSCRQKCKNENTQCRDRCTATCRTCAGSCTTGC